MNQHLEQIAKLIGCEPDDETDLVEAVRLMVEEQEETIKKYQALVEKIRGGVVLKPCWDKMQTEADAEDYLVATVVENRMKAYPYGAPHPETVRAIVDGLFAVIEVSNARPAKYADEPWLTQSAVHHADHAQLHALDARHGTPETWVSDLGQPNIAHAALRSFFCLYRHNREAEG